MAARRRSELGLGRRDRRRVRVRVVDSGVDATHPLVGPVQGSVTVAQDAAGELSVAPDAEGDAFGHGTACAAIIRKLAPDCEIHSVRVLGGELTGSGPVLLAGLRWAIEQRFEVINLSLSTTKSRFAPELRELADRAYFRGSILVASAHNMAVESFPWRSRRCCRWAATPAAIRSSTTSTPSRPSSSPPPAWTSSWPGSAPTIRATGNSFATPHMAGIAALVLSKHGPLRPFELKTALRAAGNNVRSAA